MFGLDRMTTLLASFFPEAAARGLAEAEEVRAHGLNNLTVTSRVYDAVKEVELKYGEHEPVEPDEDKAPMLQKAALVYKQRNKTEEFDG